MKREEVIKILTVELEILRPMIAMQKGSLSRKAIENQVQAYEFAVKALSNSIPIVKINEFLDINKKWCIRVMVNGELIDDENIEFISKRGTAQEVPVQEQLDGSITTKVGNAKVVINKDEITTAVR